LNNEYLVSIITPAYNCEKVISETIESVLSQTYTNYEMIIVDDCSKDNTVEVAQKYVLKDSRIRLIQQNKNQGTAVARNTGIENANGRFIAFLDSDDLWKPTKLEKQIEFMLENNYGFTFTSYEIMRENSELTGRVFHAPKTIKYIDYLKNTIIGLLTVVMDRELIGDIYMQHGYLEDVLTWMFYLKSGVTAYGYDENLASYRVVKNSKSNNKVRNAKRYFICLRQQRLPIHKCFYYELCYMFNAVKKRCT
jgi:Glycosyltransferases involved in cell wall biogenesis